MELEKVEKVMDLEKMEAGYKVAKKNIEEMQKNIKDWGETIEIIKASIKMNEGMRDYAKTQNDAQTVKDCEDKIKEDKKQLRLYEKKVLEGKKEIEFFRETINKAIEEITADPKMQELFEQVLGVRYSREIKKIGQQKEDEEKNKKESEKKKEKEEKKLEEVNAIQKIIKEHPSMKNHLQGMLTANNIIEVNRQKIKNLDPVKDKNTIDKLKKESEQANGKLDKNRTELLDYAKRKKIKITKETLEDIMKNSVIDPKTKQVSVNKTLNSTKEKVEKQIKVYDQEILESSKKISKYDRRVLANEKAISKLENHIPRDTEKEKLDKKGKTQKGPTQDEPPQKEKPKWWQFVKWFKQWRENKNRESLPEPREEEVVAEEVAKKNEFAKNLRFEVVSEAALKRVQRQKVKEAEKEIPDTIENEEQNEEQEK